MMQFKQKEELRESLAESLKSANAVIVSEYRGLTVEEVTQLRLDLRKSDAKFKVVRNRVTKKAIESSVQDMDGIKSELTGPVGLVFSYGDSAQTTKTILDFQKDHPNFVLKAGYLDDKVVSVDELKAIASLPSKEVLLGKIVGSIAAPSRGLVTVLSGVSRNLVQVVNAIKDKKTK